MNILIHKFSNLVYVCKSFNLRMARWRYWGVILFLIFGLVIVLIALFCNFYSCPNR